MNKETIYIEPEDDITDIITKIEKAKAKVIALVPPKKAGVFRSVVNMKLIAKAGKTAEKNVVLVTVDPSITKLAAASKLPVAKNLQTAPTIPVIEDDIEKTSTENVDEDGKTEDEEEKDDEEESEEIDSQSEEDNDEEEKDEEESEEENEDSKEDKKKSKKKSKNRLINWIKNHKKLSILIAILLLALIGFIIWALFIAPAVNVFVSIKTDTNNFSEALTFVKEMSEENAAEGKLYLEERKIETVQEVNFEATGQKNIGEKATGELVIYQFFPVHMKASETVVAGDKFTISGLAFTANTTTTLSYSGKPYTGNPTKDYEECNNLDSNTGNLPGVLCQITAVIKVTAAEPGEKYNIPASTTGWSTTANVRVQSDKAMGGGSDKVVTVVQQIDVEKARNELSTANEAENKEKLYASIPEDSIILESTYSQTTSNATATPAVDEEVKEGVKPTLKTTTTTSVFIIDKTKLEEFIKAKVNLPEDKKIFEIRDVYIDGFRENNGNYSGKLKAQYFTGPKLTETELVDKIKGKGLGDARREISDVEGVSEVKMDPSYPWVFVVPTDSNRITVTFEIKDQEGKTIEEKTEEEKSENSENTENNENGENPNNTNTESNN